MERSDLERILENLSKKRPVFHSEADFQFALAWEIKKEYPEYEIRLEQKVEDFHIDISVKNKKKICCLELKYKTKGCEIDHNNEEFALKDHAALLPARYDFLKDVERLEIVKMKTGAKGFAVFLTNSKQYWNKGDEDVRDADFRIHGGRKIKKKSELEWATGTSPRTIGNRKDAISLKNDYVCNWNNYSEIEDSQNRKQLFRHLILEVK